MDRKSKRVEYAEARKAYQGSWQIGVCDAPLKDPACACRFARPVTLPASSPAPAPAAVPAIRRGQAATRAIRP